MSASREPVVLTRRTRGLFLTFALVAAIGGVLVAGADHGFAATATARPAAKHAAPAKKATGGSAAATASAGATKALPDSLPRLEAAVRKDSTNVRALYKLGIAYLDRDRPADATGMFQKATKLKPDYVEAWVNLGAAEDANGHGAGARGDYRTALGLHPGDEIALCRMASSFYAAGIKDSAMDVIRDILKKDDKSSCAYFTLGVSFADANMFREAIRVWQKVVDLAPKSPEAESATESIKLLKEYLGPQEMLTAAPVTPPGIAMGAGGPDVPLPGGEMGGPKFTASPGGMTPSPGGKAEKAGEKPKEDKAGDKK